MRALLAIVATICAVSLSASDVGAEKRVALVIGNSEYTTISSLRNPRNDAALMADTLRDLGFDVILETDADRGRMARTIRDFGKRLSRAGPDTTGLFYYAGHGVQARGTNYLVPLRAPIEDELDLTVEAIDVGWVLDQMEAAGNALNLVVLDACRNNPFKGMSRSAGRGLARVDTARGALVAFAAAPGQVAADGRGENSPYTSALARAMRKPGLSVEQVFKQVRVSVESQTGGRQTPWEESSLRGDFYFVSSPEVQQAVEPRPRADAVQTNAETFVMERIFWESVKDTGDLEMLSTYLERYPEGVFSRLAKVMIGRLELRASDATMPRAPTPQTIEPPSGEQQVAAIAPRTPTAPEPEPDPDLPRKIQQALDAAGCRPGPVDGVWGRNSDAALKRFSRHAKLDPAAQEPSVATLQRLLRRKGRICPLTCDRGTVEKNGRCVARTCGAGQVLTPSGKCRAKPSRTATPTRPSPKQNPSAQRHENQTDALDEGYLIGR